MRELAPREDGSRFVGNGRYELIAHLGSGGMGDVLEARDVRLDRRVALKFLGAGRFTGAAPGGARFARAKEMFVREGHTMARIDHTYVATIYDCEVDGDDPFLVMEHVDGRPLAEYLGNDPLLLEQTVRWSRQIAEGLAAAHREGVVHRDIKPANILITHDNSEVRIIDFGLARFADATESHTDIGTPLYRSPERCRFESGDERSDLYSLGCVMYEMVIGWPPFGDRHSDAAALAKAHQHHPPVRPGQQVPDVPDALDDLIMSLLAKHPAYRPRNARAVIRAIQEVERSLDAVAATRRRLSGHDTTQVDAGITERIRDAQKRVRRLSLQFGSAHAETLVARGELAELTGESGDERGAVELYERIGRDCQRRYGPYDRRALDAFENMTRWTEGGFER
ncbi:serine/threonine-protein kinase [Streptomyces sp. x-19]|uniref:serine/threonine-protein kinase n=1 Tax=Streptomyces sp. x-19 TaxID=2789280 RepID=UPI00397FB167